MRETIEKNINQKKVKMYVNESDDLPIILCNEYMESGEAILKRCEQLFCKPFHLVSISGIEWDESLSPWPSEAVVSKDDHFTGNAPEYLEWMLGDVIPFIDDNLGERTGRKYIAGYSMAGLFALWSLYKTRAFDGAICASGSFWYPGFKKYALNNKLAVDPEGIYMSLGNKETQVANPALQHTDSTMKELCSHYQKLGIPAIFETNHGNHFKNMDLRMAKGISWILTSRS